MGYNIKSNIEEQPLKLYSQSQFPTVWTDENGCTIHGYENLTERHYSDGWKDYVTPVYDVSLQKLGELIYDVDNDVVTKEVIDKTAEEIEDERKAKVPTSITPTQGRIRLKQMNLLDRVVLIVENSEDGELQIYWEYALSWDRDSIFVEQLSTELGMSEDDLDDFYLTASQIK